MKQSHLGVDRDTGSRQERSSRKVDNLIEYIYISVTAHKLPITDFDQLDD